MAYSLYVHVPFCKSRCTYCDFYTHGGHAAVPDAYVDALLRDMALYGPLCPNGPDGAPARPATVYFGGGTPGLLAPGQVGRVLQAANPLPGAEVTLEANPGGVTPEKLAGWRAAGVNRLSMGVQTANPASLKTLGRPHTAPQAAQAFAMAKAAGFANISGDIMLALPGYRNAEFDETLALLAASGATHISAYLLKVEPGTPLAQNPAPGLLQTLPGEDATADIYLHAAEALEAAGYTQYEISNFARPGFESRHNLAYWNGDDWLGLGPSAHSHLSGRRFSFGRSLDAFVAGTLPPTEEGPFAKEDYIMLRLRLAAGLDEADLAARFGSGLTAKQTALLGQLCAAGLAHPTLAGGKNTPQTGWALTRQGLLVQNSILSRLFDD